MSRETVRSRRRSPTGEVPREFSGRPHGFGRSIRVTRALISALTGGRPAMAGRRAWSRLAEAARCHRRTVLGDTRREPASSRPHPRQRDPEESVAPEHLWPGHRLLVDGELVAQGQVLQGDMAVSAAEEGKQSKQAEQEGNIEPKFSLVSPPDPITWRRTEFWRRTGSSDGRPCSGRSQ